MMNFLLRGIACVGFLAFFSCQNNKDVIDATIYYDDSALQHSTATIPIAVTAQELCGNFSSNNEWAVSKYKKNILVLSGTVHQVNTSADADCSYITMMCSSPNPKDTTALVLRCCLQQLPQPTDSIKVGDEITIRCRFVALDQNIIQLQEVSM